MPTSTPTLRPATRETIDAAIAALRRGELVGLPTETVYGVAAWARRDDAVARLRGLKTPGRREAFTVHVGDLAQAEAVLNAAPPAARRLARRAMPGPLTLLVELDEAQAADVADALGLDAAKHDAVLRDATIGIRCPAEPTTAAVLAGLETPVVASSAQSPGKRAATDAEAAARVLGDAAELVIDGGRARYASPSTVVRFLRPAGGADPTRAYRLERVGVYDERMVDDMSRATVLFVCSGNTCRSAMAEAIAADLLSGEGGDASTRAASAGVMAMPGAPASDGAVRALGKLGIPLNGHRATPLTRDLIDRADAIFTMTRAHLDAVLALAPDAAGKASRLIPDRDVTDPIGADDAVYEQTAAMIRDAIAARFREEGLTR